jgi:hypothetical protein
VRRRKLLVTAGALSATAFATTVCLGANFGLFGLTEPDSPVGRLAPRQSVGIDAPVDTTVPVPVSTVSFPHHADD